MRYEHHFLHEDVKRAQNEHECFKYLIQKSLQQVEDGNLKKAKDNLIVSIRSLDELWKMKQDKESKERAIKLISQIDSDTLEKIL